MSIQTAEPDLSVLEDLAPPCGTPFHAEVGDGPASLIVVWVNPTQCGCPLDEPETFFCHRCWETFSRYTWCHCPDCGRNMRTAEVVVRVVPL